MLSIFFFFNDTATTEIYTLSLHDALPISIQRHLDEFYKAYLRVFYPSLDRKSTRLNSSHQIISYAVFCLKKKKTDAHNQEFKKIPQVTLQMALTDPHS